MLVTLGFLLAALLLLVFLPAYRRRIERFATDAVKRALPLTEDEIRADRDRMRAEYAINTHKLETQLEDAQLSAARQSVEINRRDARVHELDEALSAQKLTIEELQNARRVLEQAILDRLPKVEQRLAESRKLLSERDADIVLLSDTSAKQTAALEEQTQINIQQREDLQRLRTALDTRASRNRETLGDPRFDGEVALRSEIEMLRAKSRDQNALIVRLQTAANEADSRREPLAAEVDRLRKDLAKVEADLITAKSLEGSASEGNAALLARVKSLEADERERNAEIARLKSALTSYDKSGALAAGVAGQAANLSAPPALSAKAEISALQAEVEDQRRTIQSLRADLASSNERLARQTQHFSEELRRLGNAGAATGDAAKRGAESDAPKRPSLADRIAMPRLAPAMPTAQGDGKNSAGAGVAATATSDGDAPGRGSTSGSPTVVSIDRRPDAPSDIGDDAPRLAQFAAEQRAAEPSPRRPRLLERISSLDKTR